MLFSLFTLATYDVQRARAFTTGSNEISVTGEFVSNSAAKGVFIVLQSVDGSSPDVFRAVLRPESGMTLTDVIAAVPPSTYLPAFYDLEEDGLPNSSPAVEQNNSFSVQGEDVKNNALSQYVSYLSSSEVQIECDDIDGFSCVLVYREYDNKTLVVKEYPQNTVFPVTLTVDGDPENYTFAIFGKRGSNERPIVEGRVRIPTTPSTSPTRTPSGIVATVTSLCVVWYVE